MESRKRHGVRTTRARRIPGLRSRPRPEYRLPRQQRPDRVCRRSQAAVEVRKSVAEVPAVVVAGEEERRMAHRARAAVVAGLLAAESAAVREDRAEGLDARRSLTTS